jgi:hypothetical protein
MSSEWPKWRLATAENGTFSGFEEIKEKRKKT